MALTIPKRLKGFHRDTDRQSVVRATLQYTPQRRNIRKIAANGKTHIVNARAAPTITVVGGIEIVPRFCAFN
jgi:hypothetical protein